MARCHDHCLATPFYVSEFSARSIEVNKAACEKDVVGIRLFSGSRGLETRDPCGAEHLNIVLYTVRISECLLFYGCRNAERKLIEI